VIKGPPGEYKEALVERVELESYYGGCSIKTVSVPLV
jgi:hypothetical protein